MQNSPPFDAVRDERLRILVESYERLVGRPLVGDQRLLPPCRGKVGMGVELSSVHISTPTLTLPLQGGGNEELASLHAALWHAPFAIVAHGTEADPVFFYGNRLALQLFEMSFDEFVRLPSRLSAEPLAREERALLLDKVTRQGYVDGYSGMRITRSGKRFMITDGTVWNLADAFGGYHGQAAVFVAAP